MQPRETTRRARNDSAVPRDRRGEALILAAYAALGVVAGVLILTVYASAPSLPSRNSRSESGTAARSSVDRIITSGAHMPKLLETRDRWQKELALEGWLIEIRAVTKSDLPEGTIGNIHWNLPKKTALIKVLIAAEYDLPADKIAADQEITVVHELVHLRLAEVTQDNDDREEKAVVAITKALLKDAT